MQEHNDDDEVVDEEKNIGAKDMEEASEPKDGDYSDDELQKALADPHAKYDPNGPYSPGEFNRRGQLFSRISSMKSQLTRETNKLKAEMAEIKAQATQARMEGYKAALEELAVKRSAAVDIGDRQTFDQLDRKYQELSVKALELNTTSSAPDTEVTAFLARNAGWNNYQTAENGAMRDAAIAFEAKYRQDNGLAANTANAKVGKAIESYVKLRFPHRFENLEQEKPQAVASAATGKGLSEDKGKLGNYESLSPLQKEICDSLMKADPKYTVNDYLKQLGKSTAPYRQLIESRLNKGE